MATRTQSTVVAVFSNVSSAQAAAEELKKNGFSQDQIFITSAGNTGGGTTAGTATGGAADRSGTEEGGISGWFKRVFGAEDDADQAYYQSAHSSGNVLLSVEATDQNLDKVADILNRYSPTDVHREGAGTTGQAATGRPMTGQPTTGKATANTGTQDAIPVIEEELQVGKRSVQRGGVRVYSRVVETPVEETLRLQEEHVRVSRQPVDRPATAADLQVGPDQVIEMKEYAEEAVVSKQARVVEEVRIGKESTERAETIRDTVRRTEVEVENLTGAANATGSATAGTAKGGSATGFEDDFRKDFQSRYGASGGSYDTYGPAYNYGYTMANDPRYKGKSFSDVESTLRSDYGSRYPNSTWEKMKDSIKYGWDKVTGKASSANTR